MEKQITANENNNDKFLTGDLEEEKKKKQNKEQPITESVQEAPLEYFTE